MAESIKDQVAAHLKKFRTDVAKVTQRDFAALMDTTQGNISQIEAGTCQPSSQYIVKLMENFPNINLNWLYANEGEPLRSNDQGPANYDNTEIQKRFLALERQYGEVKAELKQVKEDNHKLIALLSKLSP